MQTVFSHIIQKRYSQSYEDVATDALAYILNTHDSAQRGWMKILKGIAPDVPDLRFRTQLSEGNIRPDMWGYSGLETYLYVENKFWAGLTDNQPIAYLEELASHPHQTLLLMIVPGAREQTMIAELSRRMLEAKISYIEDKINNKEIVWCLKTSLGPALALSSWPRVIEYLKMESVDNPVALSDLSMLQSLCDAADIGRFVPMNSSEINNQLIPTLILQLGQVIRDATQLGLRHQIISNQGLTETVNWEKFGKYLWLNEPNSVGIWFGLDHQLWKLYGVSPLWVKFSTTDFGRAYEIEPVLTASIDKTHLLVTLDDGTLAYSINIKTMVDKDQVIQDIVDQLKELANILFNITAEK